MSDESDKKERKLRLVLVRAGDNIVEEREITATSKVKSEALTMLRLYERTLPLVDPPAFRIRLMLGCEALCDYVLSGTHKQPQLQVEQAAWYDIE